MPHEQQDANEYSDMLGYTTIKRRQRTQGKDSSYTEVEENALCYCHKNSKPLAAQ